MPPRRESTSRQARKLAPHLATDRGSGRMTRFATIRTAALVAALAVASHRWGRLAGRRRPLRR